MKCGEWVVPSENRSNIAKFREVVLDIGSKNADFEQKRVKIFEE